MLAHWIKKDHWLANGVNCRLKKELWDGKRWSELEWFWNPDSTWTLPTCCVHCDIPIPANHLINSQAKDQDGDSNVKIVEFPVCNVPLVGHFDGWQPFGSSYRGLDPLQFLLLT